MDRVSSLLVVVAALLINALPLGEPDAGADKLSSGASVVNVTRNTSHWAREQDLWGEIAGFASASRASIDEELLGLTGAPRQGTAWRAEFTRDTRPMGVGVLSGGFSLLSYAQPGVSFYSGHG